MGSILPLTGCMMICSWMRVMRDWIRHSPSRWLDVLLVYHSCIVAFCRGDHDMPPLDDACDETSYRVATTRGGLIKCSSQWTLTTRENKTYSQTV